MRAARLSAPHAPMHAERRQPNHGRQDGVTFIAARSMAENSAPVETAWQPLTFKGVASFGDASVLRLLGVQLVFAILVGAAVVWCVDTAWSPTIAQAIRRMPEQGEIRNGRLHWTDPTPRVLGEGHFVAFTFDPRHSGTTRSPAHIQVEFGRDTVRFLSLLGYWDSAYPFGHSAFQFNRRAMEPWWGAWRPPLLWMTFAGTCVLLMCTWAALAIVLAGVSWFVAFFANRQLSFRSGWKVAGAAMMPGALLMAFAILLYGLGALGLVQLLAATAIHIIVHLTYAIGGPLRRRRLGATFSRRNPFSSKDSENSGGA